MISRYEKYIFLLEHGISPSAIADLFNVPVNNIYIAVGDTTISNGISRTKIDNALCRAFRIVFGFDPIRDGVKDE